MRVFVNGEAREVGEALSVADLLQTLGIPGVGVAVEVNQTIVRRAEHASTRLAADDRIEVVRLVGGG